MHLDLLPHHLFQRCGGARSNGVCTHGTHGCRSKLKSSTGCYTRTTRISIFPRQGFRKVRKAHSASELEKLHYHIKPKYGRRVVLSVWPRSLCVSRHAALRRLVICCTRDDLGRPGSRPVRDMGLHPQKGTSLHRRFSQLAFVCLR